MSKQVQHCCVDLQFFKVNGHFVVKEFAALTDTKLTHHVFKAPYDLSLLAENDIKGVQWLEKYYHKISWGAGVTDYEHATKIIVGTLRNYNGRVYVKGIEKVTFLNKLSIKATNIEDLGIHYRISDISYNNGNLISCKNHKSRYNVCALRNVFYMKKKRGYLYI